MSYYNFRLQRLLGFRNIQEEEAKRELGSRYMALELETNRLSSLKQEEQTVLDKWREQVQQEVELSNLKVTQEYSDLLEGRLNQQAKKYNKSKNRVEEQRRVARECWQKKRMLEILKDKAREDYKRQEQVRERNLIDEIVLNTYNRKGGD
ncbi:MAG: flagellar export protein FliJ [Bacillota bacterium]